VHEAVFYVAVAWLALLLGGAIGLVVGARGLGARILALDTLTLLLVALLALLAVGRGATYYLDAALFLALLSFAGTLAAARYQGGEDPLG
jgi:multisubunit Na+/H+ antiporter MnhF subunit